MTSKSRSDSASDGQERRAVPRIPASSVPYLTAQVAGGPSARLIDLSKHGVRIESTLQMHAGSRVVLRFVTGAASVTLAGAVLRSTPAQRLTSGEVTYHTALAFTEELTLCHDESPTVTHAGDRSPYCSNLPAETPDYTMIVTDGRPGARERPGAGAAC